MLRADTTRHPGGRPKATDTPNVCTVAVALSSDLRKRLFDAAHASDRTISGQLRAIVRAWAEQHQQDADQGTGAELQR
jgi:hypothetical protein